MAFAFEDIVFPSSSLPDDAGHARLLGLYAQRQEGLWMQRLKILGGRLTAGQWEAIAEIAREFTPNAPLHLTTRQDIEFHNLPPESIPRVQARLAEAGLTGLGACGDTLRNVTICPCSGMIPGSPDLEPMAWAIRRTLEELSFIYDLPRKFKIDVSCGSDACGRPWINDLGLVARRRDDQWSFDVIGAGSLGARPGVGMKLFEAVAPGDVPALVAAAVKLFNDEGDRENRTRARLRHVRERLGDEPFAEMFRSRFEAEKASRPSVEIELPLATGDFDGQVALTFANGDVTLDQASALAAIARRRDARVRIAAGHRVIVFGRIPSVRSVVQSMPALRTAAGSQATLIVCPGNRSCSHGLVDTNALAAKLREVLPASMTACISGCPNGCAHSGVGEIGVTGRRMTRGDEKVDGFDLLTGGGLGRSPALAKCVARKLTADEVVEHVARLAAENA